MAELRLLLPGGLAPLGAAGLLWGRPPPQGAGLGLRELRWSGRPKAAIPTSCGRAEETHSRCPDTSGQTHRACPLTPLPCLRAPPKKRRVHGQYCLHSAKGLRVGWSPGHVQGVLRLPAAVPLTGRPEPLGSREGPLCGPWVGGHGLVFQTGHAGAPWGRGGPLGAEGGLLRRGCSPGAAPDKALSGEAGAGWGPGNQGGRWWRSEPKGGSRPGAMSAAFSFLLPRGEEVCKADSETAGMGRCRAATVPG